MNNNEKEVAKIYGINPKTLHRWVTRGFKKNRGKYINIEIPTNYKNNYIHHPYNYPKIAIFTF